MSAENRQGIIFLGVIVAMVVAANLPACNPPGRSASPSQQAKEICEDVYADSDDDQGYSDCLSSAKRQLDRR